MDLTHTEAAITYHLRPLDAGARLLELQCRVREPEPSGQLLSLPAWTPGSYLIRDFARHVVAIEARQGGEPIALRKIDKATWRAAPATGDLLIRAEIFAADPSVRGAWLDTTGFFVNGASVFFRIHGREAERSVVHLSPGDVDFMADWQVATALTRVTGADGEFGAFAADDYADLIDHPILAGNLTVEPFEAAGVPHAIALAGRQAADLPRLAADLARLCRWQIGFFGEPAPMSRYLFLVRLNGEGFGGLEHRASTALVCHRNDLPHPGQATMSAAYRRFLGLASHEYFHLWNGKRISPAELADADLAREAYTRQLWVVEGITSYYDDLALLRSGLIPVSAYLELLGRTLTAVYRTPGRRRQTLEESSHDAWIKYYRPDENTPNAEVGYYQKGAMVALALDLEVRLRTGGRVSLDDVMRVVWRTHGAGSGHALAEGGFEELVAEVAGIDLGEFFRNSLRGTVDPPIAILLAQFGVRLHMRAASGPNDSGGVPGPQGTAARSWLGPRTRSVAGRLRIAHVLDGGPAQAAGLCAHDEIVAIDGLRADADGLEDLVGRLRVGHPVEVHVFRRDELRCHALTPAAAPSDTCFLSLDEQASETAIARRRDWLRTDAA